MQHYERPGWSEYFLGIAQAVSARADCSRRKVGAVIVGADKRIVSTGYNGSPAGGASCLAGACPRASSQVLSGSSYTDGPGRCIAVHAEANAIHHADWSRLEGATLYCSCEPCYQCASLISTAGITNVVYGEGLNG